MQSHNYVPGVSGWKLSKDGTLEVNSANLRSGSLSPEPQMITITAGEWSESEIPALALARYKFIGDAVMQIPAEYRDSAEFSTEDHSYDRDFSDVRTTLTYTRPEAPDEAEARVERAKVAGTKFSITNNGVTIVQDGVVRLWLGDLSQPFAVEGDQVYLNSIFVRDVVIISKPLPDDWRVKVQINSKGQHVAAGVGTCLKTGATLAILDSQLLTSADKFAVKDEQPKSEIEQAIAEGNAQKILDLIAGSIGESDVVKNLNTFNDYVRRVLRDELRAGGLLHRI